MTEKKKVGIALSGGAARGFAHIGILKALKENDIPIDFISGTSAGSFAGAAYASGIPIESIIEVGKSVSWYRLSGFSFSAKGLISNAPIADLIKTKFPLNKFEDLKIPFAAVATDLKTGAEVVFKEKGDLGFAICASCAIPGIFAPLKDEDGRLYIDGGVVAPVPAKAVKELGADVVIAVDLISSGMTYWGTPSTMLGIIFQSVMMLLRTASIHQHYQADVVIVPEIAHLRLDEIDKMEEFIEIGEAAALEKIDEIRELLD